VRTDFIREWVDALTSEEYQQAQQQLRMSHLADSNMVEHCCLGVACELGIKYGVVQRDGDEYCSVGVAELHDDPEITDWNSSVLPHGFWQWIGLEGGDPSIPGHGRLTKINDDGESFENIAKLIKEAWLEDQT